MTIDITAKTREALNNLKVISDPKLEEVLRPNYELYCCAPFLSAAQVSCLLAGFATIDWETVYTLTALRSIDLDINKALQSKGKLTRPQTSDGNWSFHDYVTYSFPVPHDSFDYLKNIYELIQKGIKEGSLQHTPFTKSDGMQENLLRLDDVVKFASAVGIEIPGEMSLALENLRPSIKALMLPKMFPNQINFGFEYNKKRIEVNQRKPIFMPSNEVTESSSVVHGHYREQQAVLSSDEMKLSLGDLIFRVALRKSRTELLNSEGIVQLRQLLSKLASLTKALFHRTHWHPVQLSLAFYGIDYHAVLGMMKGLTSHDLLIFLGDIAHSIDGEARVFENFSNYVVAQGIHPLKTSIEDFNAFASANSIKLPPHWPKPSPSSKQSKSTNGDSLKTKKPTTLRKEMMGMAAELVRKRAESDSKPSPKSGTLAKNKDLIALVNLINKIGGLQPVIDDIDPEWLAEKPSNKESE